ncbi:Ser/Thr phosphatase family protein [Cooperia oncophora]
MPFRSHDYTRRVQPCSLAALHLKVSVSTSRLVLEWDEDNDVVPELASSICELVAKQSSVVCQGITTQFKEEFFYVFRQLAEKNPSAICGLLLDECSDPSDQNGSGWAIVLPPKPPKELKAIIDKKRTQFAHPRGPDHRYLRVLQLSDVHVDFDYKPGSEAKCDLFLCCRNTTGWISKHSWYGVQPFFIIGKPKKPAGYWGTVATCDIPYRMFRNMLEHINATAEIDYIMLSGDFIDHAIWTYSIEGHKKALRNVSALIREFFPLTPTYWAIGNHEGVPTNSFAPHFVDKRFWPTWLYEEFSIMGAPWLNNEALKTMLYRGSYSVKVTDGLRLISLNTGFCENTNFFLYLNQSDPDGTMTWFVSELFKAELTGESVHVLSHIPPGDDECLEGSLIPSEHSFSVTSHFDQFTVFYDDMHNVSSTPIGVLYVAPSVTTYTNVNPAYRIYDIDLSDKFNVANIRNYYADLTKTNEKTPPKWTMLYAAKVRWLRALKSFFYS